MLPTERATVLREKKTGAEIKPFSKLIPGLLESYNKPNMMKYMVSLDSLISSRLNASERQRKFQELANFEQMARENLEIEKAVRERKEREEKEAAEKEAAEKEARKLAEKAAKRAGGDSGASESRGSRQSRGRRASGRTSLSPTASGRRLTARYSKSPTVSPKASPAAPSRSLSKHNEGAGERSRRDSQQGHDAIERELERSGVREPRKTASKETYMKRLTQPVKIGGK